MLTIYIPLTDFHLTIGKERKPYPYLRFAAVGISRGDDGAEVADGVMTDLS